MLPEGRHLLGPDHVVLLPEANDAVRASLL
jgi:hypothetical protein